MGIDEAYAREEEMIIEDETLTEKERNDALRDLYREGINELDN